MKKALIVIVIAIIGYLYFSGEEESSTAPATRGAIASETTRLYVDTENLSNSTVVFNCYIPSRKENETLPVLIIIGGGHNVKGDYFVTGDWKAKAEKERFIIIAPSFKGDNNDFVNKESFQFPSHWSGKAIKDAVTMLDGTFPVDYSSINIFGHSAGAQLAHRFILQNDVYIRKAAIHAPGQVTLATSSVQTDIFLTIGSKDTSRKQGVKKFYNSCKENGIDIEFKEYSDVGHMLSVAQIADSFDFFSF